MTDSPRQRPWREAILDTRRGWGVPLEGVLSIDRLREAVDLALFDAEEGHSHPACRATFRRVAMAAFDAEYARLQPAPLTEETR